MPIRSATAVWEGPFTGGKGVMSMDEGSYEGAYSAPSRFEEADGTSPEDFVAAAHSGCFSMALSAGLSSAGFPPNSIKTTAQVHLNKGEAGWRITKIELSTEAQVPGIDDAEFQEKAKAAKENCPVSVALGGVDEIVLQAKLV